MVGGGDTAAEEAIYLTKYGKHVRPLLSTFHLSGFQACLPPFDGLNLMPWNLKLTYTCQSRGNGSSSPLYGAASSKYSSKATWEYMGWHAGTSRSSSALMVR